MKIDVLEAMKLPVPAAIIYHDSEWFFADVNSKFLAMTGYEDRDEVINEPTSKILFGINTDLMEIDLGEVAQGLSNRREIHFVDAHGKNQWCLAAAGPYDVIDGKKCIIATYESIQKQKEIEAENRLLENKYQLVREITGEIPFDLDVQNWIILESKAFDELKPNSANSERVDKMVPFRDALKQVHPLDRDDFAKAMVDASRVVKDGIIELRVNISSENEISEFKWFRLFYRSVADENGKIIRVIGRSYNIDEDKVRGEEARRDYLTKFLTRGELIKSIDKQFVSAPDLQYVLLVIDIDNFKSINDTFGHTYGDTVIVDNASVIRSKLPDDAIIGRIGGDEFVVLLIDYSIQRAKQKTAELCEALEREYTGDGVVRHISASIGLAEYGRHGNTYKELFDQADRAMYRVKQGGKNGYQVANQKDVAPIENRIKEFESRTTLLEDDQHFMMFAVNLMTHARNIDGSLNMLLKRLASEYNFSHIMLFEAVPDSNNVVLTNYYSYNMSFYEKTTFPKEEAIGTLEDVNRVIIVKSEQLPEESTPREWYRSNNFTMPEGTSMGIGVYDYLNGRTGSLCFVAEQPDYEWSDRLRNFLMEITRMISIFVTLRYRMDESKAEIRHIQRRDQLTGLYNFEPFKSRVAREVKNGKLGQIFILEYMDVNNFGYINENYGYKVGDQVLKHFANDLRGLSCFVAGCRIYSDFFINLYVGENVEKVIEVVRAQHRRFTNMQNYQYPSSGIGISSGIYIFGTDMVSIDTAVENVNMAWKKAKAEPRTDFYVFEPELKAVRVREQQILGEFYESLYRDDFKLYLQPKFILGAHDVYGAEALVRWKKPNGDIMTPSEFLDPLEKIGYITELDFYIFEELLKTVEKWKKMGKRQIVCSTNFSGKHFEHGGVDFINRIRMITSRYSVLPANIEIEITESVFVKDRNVLRDCIKELRQIGFRIAIDDFGTGYSSLSILSEIPADVIKMDKSFLDMGMSDYRREILREFSNLIAVAGKETIFEGVETVEQERFLMDCGYKRGQGFLINKPIPALEFEKQYLDI